MAAAKTAMTSSSAASVQEDPLRKLTSAASHAHGVAL